MKKLTKNNTTYTFIQNEVGCFIKKEHNFGCEVWQDFYKKVSKEEGNELYKNLIKDGFKFEV